MTNTTYGDATHTLQLTVDSWGRVVSVKVLPIAFPPPPTTPAPPPPVVVPPPTPLVYWGILNDQPWTVGQQQAFETLVGKRASLAHVASAWQNGGTPQPFPATYLDGIVATGAIPSLDWYSNDTQGGRDQPAFANALVTSGTFDAYLHAWARACATWGKPLWVRFDTEMNGPWESYCDASSGNTPGSFVAMWRHVVGIFAAEAATNVTWHWCPNLADPSVPLAQYWPGDDVVGWSGVDAYNPSTGGPFTQFLDVVGATYNAVHALSPSKPMGIGETGCVESTTDPSAKAAWLTRAYADILSQLPAIRAVMYFHINFGAVKNYKLDTSALSLAAFRAAISDPRYVGAPLVVPSGTIAALAR